MEESLKKLSLESSSEGSKAKTIDYKLLEKLSLEGLMEFRKQKKQDDDACYYSDEEERTPYDKQMRIKFYNQIYESGGFDVEPGIKGNFIRIFHLCNPNPEEEKEEYETVCRYSKMGIDKYNIDNGTNYEFVRFVKSMWQLVGGEKYYLTFEAQEASDSGPTVFQALVYDGFPPDGDPAEDLESSDDESEDVKTEFIEVILVRKKSDACEKDNKLLLC